MQNTSHAVMAQRHEPRDSADNFPTPPWATRALIEFVVGKSEAQGATCLEPACGQGHMARPLQEYFDHVEATDLVDYGYGSVRDFLNYSGGPGFDWVITNPPFRLAEEFVDRALSIADSGVSILARTVFLESVGRYRGIFQSRPPNIFAQFSERVPMVRGGLDRAASTATGYAWFVWRRGLPQEPRLMWIPPCRRQLERDEDYDDVRGTKEHANRHHGVMLL